MLWVQYLLVSEIKALEVIKSVYCVNEDFSCGEEKLFSESHSAVNKVLCRVGSKHQKDRNEFLLAAN